MKADEAQATVARCLVDPQFLASTAAEAGTGGSDSSAFPMERLILFRGFITAIKHNGLRTVAPLTIRLLHAHNAEISFFADMAPAYQEARLAGPLPMARLFAHFESRLIDYLPRLSEAARIPIEAMLRHEGCIWRTAAGERSEAAGSGPRLIPGGRIAHFPIDVLALGEQLAGELRGPPPAPAPRDQFLFYRPDPDGARYFETDALSAIVLSRLDGGSTLDELCRDLAAALDFATPEPIATLIEDAAAQGMVVGAGRRGG